MDTAHIPHGTNRGYQKHLRTRTEPCRKCKDAHAAVKRDARTTGDLLGELIALIAGECKKAGWYS